MAERPRHASFTLIPKMVQIAPSSFPLGHNGGNKLSLSLGRSKAPISDN